MTHISLSKIKWILTSVFWMRIGLGFVSFLSFLLSHVRTLGGLKEWTVSVLWHVVAWLHCAGTETPLTDTNFCINTRLKRWLFLNTSPRGAENQCTLHKTIHTFK